MAKGRAIGGWRAGWRAWGGCAAALVGASLLLSSCLPGTVRVKVDSGFESNAGRPFFVIVQATDAKAFLTITYDEAAALIMDRDESVLAAELVYPGQVQFLRVRAPDKKDVAVYALFTEPGKDWKVLVHAGEVRDVHLTAGVAELVR